MTHDIQICHMAHHQFDKTEVYCILEITKALHPLSVTSDAKFEDSKDAFYASKEIWIDLAIAISAIDVRNSTSQFFVDISIVSKLFSNCLMR